MGEFDKVIDFLLAFTDLQRTFHNCQMHNDSDACQYIDEKKANVKKKKTRVHYYKKLLFED